MKRLSIMLTLAACAALAGCLGANPAARSNHAAYRDIGARIEINGASNVVSITNSVGDGIYADASGGGDAMENTPTQTTTTKPEVAVGVGGGTAGTGGSTPSSGIVGEALNTLMAILGGTAPAGTKLTTAQADALKECINGNCEITPAPTQ